MRVGVLRWARRGFVGLCVVLPHSVAGAQTTLTSLVGVVRDSAGEPISGVEVRLKGMELGTLTTSLGGFRLTGIPVGKASLVIRRLGYVPANHDVILRSGRIDSLVVSLEAMAATLPGVQVVEEANARSRRFIPGFWDRRSRGFGRYITRDEIEARDPHDFSDILRMLPGVGMVTKNGRRDVRVSRGQSPRGDCPPLYFVDGVRIEGLRADELSVQDIEGVEVYSGPATIPVQFTPRFNSNSCGVIVVWTRVPGT